MLHYCGESRRGVNRTGVSTRPILKLAEEFYLRRWRWAEIKDEAGEIVGEVGPGPEGRRGWWADSSA